MVVGTGGGVVADSTGLPARPVAHARHHRSLSAPGRDGAPVVDDDGHARQGRAAAFGSLSWLLLLVQKQNLVVAATPRIDPTCIWYFGWMCIAVLKLTCVNDDDWHGAHPSYSMRSKSSVNQYCDRYSWLTPSLSCKPMPMAHTYTKAN